MYDLGGGGVLVEQERSKGVHGGRWHWPTVASGLEW